MQDFLHGLLRAVNILAHLILLTILKSSSRVLPIFQIWKPRHRRQIMSRSHPPAKCLKPEVTPGSPVQRLRS